MQDFFSIDHQTLVALAIAGPFAIALILELIAFIRLRKGFEHQKRKIVGLEKEVNNNRLNRQEMEERWIVASQRDISYESNLTALRFRIELLTTALGIIRPYTRLIARDDRKLEVYIRQLRAPKKKKQPVKHLEIDKNQL